ncbi:MAG: hypothetical protein O2783_04330, partial [Chloroflexi bacterium]|nr:hypothetical protein [Chloroflexota bacterium]
ISVILGAGHDLNHLSSFWGPPQSTTVDNSLGHIKGNQEDVVLLVAFEDGPLTHLVLLEAKGATDWTNKQMCSKAKRLQKIFGETGTEFPGVNPHFVLISPKPPTKRLETEKWPQWMRGKEGPTWIRLNWRGNLVKVTRCEAGPDSKPSQSGEYWKVEELPSRANQ